MFRLLVQLMACLNLRPFLSMLANVVMAMKGRAYALKSLTVVQNGDTAVQERIIVTPLGQSRMKLQTNLSKQKNPLVHVVEEVLAMVYVTMDSVVPGLDSAAKAMSTGKNITSLTT